RWIEVCIAGRADSNRFANRRDQTRHRVGGEIPHLRHPGQLLAELRFRGVIATTKNVRGSWTIASGLISRNRRQGSGRWGGGQCRGRWKEGSGSCSSLVGACRYSFCVLLARDQLAFGCRRLMWNGRRHRIVYLDYGGPVDTGLWAPRGQHAFMSRFSVGGR